MHYIEKLTNGTRTKVFDSIAYTYGIEIKYPVKDIKALGAGEITYTDNQGDSSTVPVLQGELLYLQGKISVTASTVKYVVYT